MKRLRNGIWYASFRYKGKLIEYSLKATKNEEFKAITNLAHLIATLERGEDPSAKKQKLDRLSQQYLDGLGDKTVKGRYEIALRLHVLPFFGSMLVGEVDDKAILDFVKHREKTDKAARDTLKKELRVIQDIIRQVDESFKLPKVEFAYKGRTPGRALELDEVLRTQRFVRESSIEFGETYEVIYQILAFTGMDIKEVVNLKWGQIDLINGWVKVERYKTGNPVSIPICGRLDAVLRSIKVKRLDGCLFTDVTCNAVSIAIRRAFKRAGLDGFGAKSLRHFVASALANAGEPQAVISSILGHSAGSRCTQTYIHAYGSAKKKAFGIFDKNEPIHFENGASK